MALLDEVQYDSLFSFKYSRRPNTSALELDDHVPEEEKSRRLAIVQEKQRAIQIRRNSGRWGPSKKLSWKVIIMPRDNGLDAPRKIARLTSFIPDRAMALAAGCKSGRHVVERSCDSRWREFFSG